MQTKRLNATVEAATDKGIVAKITTDSIDRDGEVLVPQGMNSKEFESNPILFWNHDYSQPVGNVTNIKRGDRDVFGTLNFAKRTEGVKGEFFPEVAESLVKQGFVKGVSVGFVPEGNGSRSANTKDRKKYGDGCKRIFNRWKLLEVSIAPLPANQDALVQAVDKGLMTPIQCKAWFGVDVPTKERHSIKLQSPRKKHQIKLTQSRRQSRTADTTEEVAAMVARLRGTLYL
jgi:HK97 family phage prohead protease